MENESSHQDDEIVLKVQGYLKDNPQRKGWEEYGMLRALLDRIMEKKVEIRGLEAQVNSLQRQLQKAKDKMNRKAGG